jgi:hypothetical protein
MYCFYEKRRKRDKSREGDGKAIKTMKGEDRKVII